MDIHSGGVDLRFPHHTNEIAQCAAHDNIDPAEWVKYWMHTGHLYIEGRKMSKSLKNFISIKDFISGSYSTHPALDFRIFCLQYKYHSSVHFSQDRIDDAKSFRRKVESYLALAEAVTSSAGLRHSNSKVSAESVITALSTPSALSAKSTKQSRDLKNSLSVCRKAVSKALADDFDTPEALRHMSYLLGDAIRYILP
jgi:cysteinyl-tRNA synthetase